jgi:hypothetical protein
MSTNDRKTLLAAIKRLREHQQECKSNDNVGKALMLLCELVVNDCGAFAGKQYRNILDRILLKTYLADIKVT